VAKVVLSKSGAAEFEKVISVLTDEDKISLRYWITFVERNGIFKAQNNPSFRDHHLNGKWEGYRASSFGFSARVIYRLVDSGIEIVEIERITTTHNYKRQ
jgi:mRNA-degrading endonuclease YafQ of YafQ-DinJ toxin-antitoxin module